MWRLTREYTRTLCSVRRESFCCAQDNLPNSPIAYPIPVEIGFRHGTVVICYLPLRVHVHLHAWRSLWRRNNRTRNLSIYVLFISSDITSSLKLFCLSMINIRPLQPHYKHLGCSLSACLEDCAIYARVCSRFNSRSRFCRFQGPLIPNLYLCLHVSKAVTLM